MRLRLYRQPHKESAESTRIRFLFEGVSSEIKKLGYDDFYIYIWLDKSGLLKGFQAILNDTITMTSINGAEPIVTCLSNDVIERATTGMATKEDEEKIKIVVGSMVCDDFSILLDRIKMSMFGENIRYVRLAEGEMKLFKKLCKTIN